MASRSPARDINYLSKDFESIKTDLIDYVKRHFPSDWRDFNDASGGMALLELMAYVGDVLSFNIDRQVNEAYINRAVETKNIVLWLRILDILLKILRQQLLIYL